MESVRDHDERRDTLPVVASCEAPPPPAEVITALTHAPVPAALLCVCPPKVLVAWMNAAAERLAVWLGAREPIGADLRDLLPRAQRDDVATRLDDVAAGRRQSSEAHFPVDSPSGARTQVDLTFVRLNAGDGYYTIAYARGGPTPTQWQGPAADELAGLHDPVHPHGLFAIATDANGRIVAVTDEACRQLRLDAERLLYTRISDLAPDDDARARIDDLRTMALSRTGGSGYTWVRLPQARDDESAAAVLRQRVPLAVQNRLHCPVAPVVLWHRLTLDEPPRDPTAERDGEEYAAFLERRLAEIGEQVERAGIAVRLGGQPAPRVLPGVEQLTAREREVFELLARGLRVPTVAERLYLSQSTVRNHVSALFRKLRVSSQAELLERLAGATETSALTADERDHE